VIVEGIVTSLSPQGELNVAPMGPIVDSERGEFSTLLLRPFPTSTTYANLLATGQGVFHVTDDVLLITRALLGTAKPDLLPSSEVLPPRLADCCRFFEFVVQDIDLTGPRPRMTAAIRASGRVRDFFGLNRAKSAVLEIAILVSRLDLLAEQEILDGFRRHRSALDKTGGAAEREAWGLLEQQVLDWRKQHNPNAPDDPESIYTSHAERIS